MDYERIRGYFKLRIRKDWHFRRVMETAPAMRWLNPQTGERILDIGCGDGTYDYRIARKDSLVTGLEINHQQLLKARRYHAKKNLDLLRANAAAMPVKNGSFDVVVSFCVFEHLQNDDQVLAEVNRALRSGGRLLLTLDSLSRPDVSESWRDNHRVRHEVRQFYTVATIESKLQGQGFRLVRFRYLLSSPIDFSLIKLSYATEKMQPLIANVVRTALITFGRGISTLMGFTSQADNGWTLMVEACKI